MRRARLGLWFPYHASPASYPMRVCLVLALEYRNQNKIFFSWLLSVDLGRITKTKYTRPNMLIGRTCMSIPNSRSYKSGDHISPKLNDISGSAHKCSSINRDFLAFDTMCWFLLFLDKLTKLWCQRMSHKYIFHINVRTISHTIYMFVLNQALRTYIPAAWS